MTGKQNDAPEQQFIIQRFYIKDISFESPNAPEVFNGEWKPDMSLDVHTSSQVLGEDNYEVIVHLTVTVKSAEKVAFLVEVKQAGIFTITGFSAEKLEQTLACFCAATLYPYSREVVTDLVMKGGFPQLLLPPVNFDAIFDAQKEKQTQTTKENTH